MSISRIAPRNWPFAHPDLVFPFLAPAVQSSRLAPSHISTARFSTSPPLWKRDNNRNRGVSALRRTGPRRRQTLSVLKEPLPVPVLDPKQKSAIEGDPDHGLWEFFNKDKTLLATPEEDMSCGRAWAVEELREKSWDDLHTLWWVCVKERNRLATEMIERNRLQVTYGNYEGNSRAQVVKETQRSIMHVLTERWYAWEAARKVAKTDEEVNLTGQGPAYTPKMFSDDEEEWFEPERDEAGPEPDKFGEAHIKAGKDMPKADFFNTPQDPPTLKEKMTEKVKRAFGSK